MVHGPQPGSISALCDSDKGNEQSVGDRAGESFARLISAQLAALATLLLIFTFSHAGRDWVEGMELHDTCMARTQVMTCLDWGLNGALFLVLLPLSLGTVKIRNQFFRWALWIVWSAVLVLDLALFIAAYEWRTYGTATVCIMVGYVILMAALAHVPRSLLLLTWGQAYNWAVKVGLLGGLILVICTQDTTYAYVALASAGVTVAMLYFCQLIMDACPPNQVLLGSMFFLFPEGLLVALWILRRGGSDPGPPETQPLMGRNPAHQQLEENA